VTSKINLSTIFSDHLATLRDEGDVKLSATDLFVMFGIPALAALGSIFFGFHIPNTHIGTLISAFAIFGGLLFNVLVLIYSFSSGENRRDENGQRLVRQSFANISFAVMSSLLAVILLVILLFSSGVFQIIVEGMIYFVGINFILTMLMVLKRIHILLRANFDT
jgi:hypothetical protein